MGLSKEAILKAPITGLKQIEIPEWGGSIYLRKWSGKDRNKFLAASVSISGNGDVEVNYNSLFDNMVKAVALTLCDETGLRLFDDSEEDVSLLGNKEHDVLQRLYNESIELNSLKAGSVEEAAKNSSAILNEGSISGLQESSDLLSENSLNG